MSVAGFRVRAADAEDLDRVLALERAIAEAPHWAEVEYAAIVKADREVDDAVRRCLLVAEAEDRLVGFAVGKVIGLGGGRLAELESVMVELAARRSGVGRALCRAVVAWCREQDAAEVELEVRAGNAGAMELYAGLGFVVAGRRRDYYRGPVEDAVLMRLELVKSN